MDNLTAGNPVAHAVRVYYFGTSRIYEGMPVCYDNSTTNWFGGSVADTGEITISTTTAEGSLNKGKYIRVENPNTDNVSMFAGVVKKGGWVGKTGPKVLDIYVPNGAVVPVRTDSNCLIDQTILAVTIGQQELGVPLETDSRPVAIARETSDLGTAGLVLAELNPDRFIYQDMGGTALSIDDADTTTGTLVNGIQLSFLGTSAYQKGLYCKGTISGAGACVYGMWKFRTVLNAAAKDNIHVICANLHLTENATLTDPESEHGSTAIYATVETVSTGGAAFHDGTLSGGNLSILYGGYYVKATGANPNRFYWFHFNSNTTAGYDRVDGLINCVKSQDIALTPQGDASQTHKIPILIDGVTFYIMVNQAA